jgi:bifunctional ADP-heptose synthase (sugar kinase/adenylyltransferase)
MWRKEPVIVLLTGADAAVIAVLTALMALGVMRIDGATLASISAAIVACTTLAAAVIRAHVVPVDTAAAREIDALFTPVPGVRTRDDDFQDGH